MLSVSEGTNAPVLLLEIAPFEHRQNFVYYVQSSFY